MLRPRIIPCLLVHNGGLVKTVRFQQPKYVGDPVNAVRIFNEKESDELMVLDIDCTRLQREPNFRLIAQLAAECRMPLCYGGGVKSAHHARTLIGLGVEKVAISSAAVENPDLVADIASSVGRQSVTVVLDVKRERSGGYRIWTNNASLDTGKDAIATATLLAKVGAGEIVVNSIDQDGSMAGYDLKLARLVRDAVDTPITVLGGAGNLSDMRKLFEACGVVGAAAGSLFVFKGPYKAVLINYPSHPQKEDLLQTLATLAPGGQSSSAERGAAW